jgi:hypothetical protein
MSNTAATKAAHESKDMDRAIARIVDNYGGMQWLVVLDCGRIVDAAYDMRTARGLLRPGSFVKNVHTGFVVARRAA